ncbi:hypothetical protein QEG98_02340 [Myxococcus sp. MxC21-1]|uniref:hypothetical protein n=1 Tax=Myxococcus sp. MxC21-1 TaxID=3041439 RepID=UPI00292D3560|nr:hypothetical protein [Myxococcus sp. MxC21-1]WNZ62687.1 hypothetical protein QEG98_02340 [Myxococcus sp. MxC21-1]
MQRNDPGLFSEAARVRMAYPDEKYADVLSAVAFLELRINDVEIILRRPIVGGRVEYVEMEMKATGERRNLLVGHGTFVDDVGGLQANLFRLAKMPAKHVLTPKGRESPLYLENLASLFFIEQRAGWSHIQSLQTHRYQQLELEEATIEYLLGLENQLATRLATQRGELDETFRKRELADWADRVSSVAVGHGLKVHLPGRAGSLSEIADKYRTIKLRDLFESQVGWNFAGEHERLTSKVRHLQERLNSATAPKAKDAAAAEASNKVVALKHALHDKQEQSEILRRQLASQRNLHSATTERVSSAADLLRLKQSNVGFFDRAECPTCHSTIEPSNFELQAQSLEEVAASIESAKRDAEALRHSIRETDLVMQKLLAEIREIEREYAASQRALRLIADASNPNAEAIADITSSILSAERDLDRAKTLESQLLNLQIELEKWLTDVGSETAKKPNADAQNREKKIVAAFESEFRAFLGAIGHGDAVRELKEVRLDDRYVPLVGNRRLRSLGSASDQPRTVLSYIWALMDIAVRNGGWHPGFLVADEPLQQNPDKKYRKAWCNFIAARSKVKEVGQVIILTSLFDDDLAILRAANVPLVELPEPGNLLGPITK